ncbi:MULTISPECIES: glucan biosynthesis protein [unclassified Aureimonas]|uniref:glucan biosynthesis protein n=1 Tax=unclassified Aureimonas TaxID=2615206 RepID=UPI0006F257AE|nr:MULTISPECIES: glucan biosynthesis protein G [unclassified Aureimonas]KQT64103.1 glucan biosynthesis protein D [Aureimonas sp. Leaf427]KQT81697.1 glucan biosynthesis protein D [Aureimonas sp. Leaf460]
MSIAGIALAAGAARGAFAQTPAPAPAAPAPEQAPSQAANFVDNFDYESFSAMMRRRSETPFVDNRPPMPDVLANLSYDEHRAIRYRPERALWRDEPVNFQLQAFSPGFLVKETTRLFVGDGKRFDLKSFTGADFEYRAPLDPTLFQSVGLPGIAGFRLHYPLQRPDYFDELITFLGASYFRALGMGTRYGLSARGLAINTATGTAEEFPRFSAFYVVHPEPGAKTIRVFAELDSPSLTGAYAFVITPGPQTMIDVTARLYFRNAVDRLGVAPLTSMFTFGENDRRERDDFRPEVHDSDGLAIYRRTGERLFRPLKNPGELALSYFQEQSPVAFGLVQRDRDFSHYQDVEARYDLRPSLLIEPLGDWGQGMVELVEIPTDSEANDNIVAFWVPERRPEAGSQYEFRYRMHWGLQAEDPNGLASVTATLGGVGGNAADVEKSSTRRFAINFTGGTAANLPLDAVIDPIIDVAPNAKLVNSHLDRLPDGGWRLSMEFEKLDGAPVELRAKLSMLQRIISETWLYQWTGTV